MYQARYAANCIFLRQTNSDILSSSLAASTPSDCQYTFIISYVLLSNNILISFDRSLCSLKHITFLIILLCSISKSSHFCFFFGLVNSLRYFSLLVFPCFHSFHPHHVSLCYSGHFVHSQLPSAAFSKTPFKTFH